MAALQRCAARPFSAWVSVHGWLAALCAWIALGGSLWGCSGAEPHDLPLPSPLRVGILPIDQSIDVRDRFEPLRLHLSTVLEVPVELVLPDSYDELLALFHHRDVDLAWFGGFTFALANRNSGATPIVAGDTELQYSTVFLVSAGSPIRSVEDARGTTFAFGSRLSTSGHLMPRYHLLSKGIVPETDFQQVRYSGRHDTTAIWVRDHLADVGVLSGRILRRMIADGRLDPQSIRVLEQTVPYPDYVWSIQPCFGRTAIRQIRDAFLQLSLSKPEHVRILELLDVDRYLPTDVEDFSEIQTAIELLAGAVRSS